jgi:hypothetical protein
MELALKLDEDDKNVEATLIYMQSMNLLIELDPHTFDIPQVRELTGSETDSAERKRRQRKREKEAKSVTLSHQSHALVTSGHKIVPTEIETEKEIELEIETDTEIESDSLFEKWLDEYSSGKETPPAYKAIMRKRVLEGNTDARNTFLEWKRSYLEKLQKEENEKKIQSFDYNSMVGSKINGMVIERVVTLENSNYVDLFFEDGTLHSFAKNEVYQWIHQQRKEAV